MTKNNNFVFLTKRSATGHGLIDLIEKSQKYYMMPPAAEIHCHSKSFTLVVEIWQSQKYWRALSKWSESFSQPEFVDNVSYYASSKFPTDFSWISNLSNIVIDCDGTFEWEAGSEWRVDKSKRYGSICEDGWMYGNSFLSIMEDMKAKKTCESNTDTFTKKRRRVWVRTLHFIPNLTS